MHVYKKRTTKYTPETYQTNIQAEVKTIKRYVYVIARQNN